MLALVTPLVLTYNEERNIYRVLQRLDWAARIVVVDSFSTDRTVEIVQSFPQVELLQRRFESFADQCNFGLTQVRTEWVLSLDADYVCTPDLIREIARLPHATAESGFSARFRYCIGGRPLRRSLYPPRVVLYRADRARYVNDGHAHRVRIDGPIGKLSSFIHHDDRKPLNAWLQARRLCGVRRPSSSGQRCQADSIG